MTTTRALTKAELQILRQRLKFEGLPALIGPILGGTIMLTGFGVLVVYYGWAGLRMVFDLPNQDAFKYEIVFGCLIMGTICAAWEFYKEFQHARTPKAQQAHAALREDIANGQACETQYSVVSAFEIEEYEDEGATFLLSLQDGRVLWVGGQDYYPYAHNPEPELDDLEPDQSPHFPSTKIIYVSTPKSDTELDVRSAGTYLEPAFKLRWPHKGPMQDVFDDVRAYGFNDISLDEIIDLCGFTKHPLRDEAA